MLCKLDKIDLNTNTFYDFIDRMISNIAQNDKIIGPFLNTANLLGADFKKIHQIIPLEAEIEMRCWSDNVPHLNQYIDHILLKRYDQLRLIFGNSFCVEVELENPNRLSPSISCIYYPAQPGSEWERIDYSKLLSGVKRCDLLTKVIEKVAKIWGKPLQGGRVDQIAKKLIFGDTNSKDEGIEDSETGFLFKRNSSESKSNLALSVSIKPPLLERSLFTYFIDNCIQTLGGFLLWSARAYGNKERMVKIGNCVQGATCVYNVGGTTPLTYEFMQLQLKDLKQWENVAKAKVISVSSIRELGSLSQEISFERIALRWENVGPWIISATDEYSANSSDFIGGNNIEVVVSKQNKVSVYLTIGDDLPKAKIKKAIESKMGVTLKRCN